MQSRLRKVKTLSVFYYNNITYNYGDVLEIPESLYNKLSNSFILLDDLSNDDALLLKKMQKEKAADDEKALKTESLK